jgi:hypothetical protein
MMAINVEDLRKWLKGRTDDEEVAIDEGGLQLVNPEDPENDYIEVGGISTGEVCNGEDCFVAVHPEDPYYATPCGTYCSTCMRKHVKDCGICVTEFGGDFK